MTDSLTLPDYGQYEIVSHETVQALHQRFLGRLDAMAREAAQIAAPEAPDSHDTLCAAGVDILLEATRLRVPGWTAQKLADAFSAALVNDHDVTACVTERKAQILAVAHARETRDSFKYGAAQVPVSKMEAFKKAAENRQFNARIEEAFKDSDRIYLRMKNKTSALHSEVAQALAEMPARHKNNPAGYAIVDWSAGKATDRTGKQVFKIGKLLQDHAPHLLDSFKRRTVEKQMVVISRNVDDIARASTNRAWHSCAGAGSPDSSSAFNKMDSGIRAGLMIAYLVSENDPAIHNPLARMMIGPFVRDITRETKAVTVMQKIERMFNSLRGMPVTAPDADVWVPGIMYGLHNDMFEAVVRRFVDECFNVQTPGRYWLAAGVYSDYLLRIERKDGVTVARYPLYRR